MYDTRWRGSQGKSAAEPDGGTVRFASKTNCSAAALPAAAGDLKYAESALIDAHQRDWGFVDWPMLQSPFGEFSAKGKFMLPDRSSITNMSSGLSVAIAFVSADDPADTSGPCATADGWQYSPDKQRIVLCGPSCEKVRADEGGSVSIALGCITQVR